jgi:hypothetical protein
MIVLMRRPAPLLLALSILLTSALPLSAQVGAERVPIAAADHYFALTRPSFSGAAARDVVAFMDSYFRVPGNTGFNASIHRVEDILKGAGYVEESAATSDARLTYRIEHRPLRDPTWEPVDASVTIVGESAPLLRFATNRNMLAINSASTPDTGVVAELIDVGKATPAELARASVAGKILFAEGGIGQVYAQGQRLGAIGAMSYRMPSYTQPEVHRNSIQFGSVNDTTGGWGIPLSRNAFDRLRAALARGPVRVRVMTKTKIYPSEELTLIADVHGSVRPDERFVLSAHVQEPGANDNASGVGTLAEMARVIGSLVTTQRIDPKRSITMLFGDEIKQTRDYLAKDSVRTRGVLWGLSLDMVGEDTRKTGGTFLIEKMPDPSAIWTRGNDKHSEWGGSPITKEQLRPHYFNDYLLARCLDQAATNGWVVKTNPFEGGSDHTPFLQYNKPGVLFWHFTDVFYHTDGDRLENVSAQTMSNVGNAALVSALTLTSADGATARALVAEVERAANARISAETALSRAALAAGGDLAHETDIVATWIDYYAKALETMDDIEVGGSSPATTAAINAAAARIRSINPRLTGSK